MRRALPWFLIDMGVAAKGRRDCGNHDWYRQHDDFWRCYHCEVGEFTGADPYVSDALRDFG